MMYTTLILGIGRRPRPGFTVSLLVFGTLAAGWLSPLRAQPAPGVIAITTGLESPVDIASAGDERLFIAEQAGVIKILRPGGDVDSQPFLDIQAKVTNVREQGLIGLAFHPSYPDNGYFYVTYSALDGATLIARYSVSSNDPNAADPVSEKILLRIEQSTEVHKGGDLNFGPNGYLHIAVGDGGMQSNSQLRGSLLGKLLRIDVDGGDPYSIPPDNPFVDNPGISSEIWAFGLRNPFRFSFDSRTGDMFIADVGEGLVEEINWERAGDVGGHNYGWPCFEGSEPHREGCEGPLTLPIHEYTHDAGCSVIGGFVYRGTEYPDMSGHYFFSDFCSGVLWSLAETDEGVLGVQSYGQLFPGFSVATFGEDASGELYVGGISDGTVYKLAPGLLLPAGAFAPLAAKLTVTTAGNGGGTVGSNLEGIDCGAICESLLSLDGQAILTAIPDERSIFEGWSGDCAGSGVVRMNGTGKNCIATFTLKRFALTVSKAGAGSGTVTTSPEGIDCGDDCMEEYDIDTVLQLTVTPDAESMFRRWTGDDDCRDGTVTMEAPRACAAVFTLHAPDHFLCYGIKPRAKGTNNVTLADQFEEKEYRVKKSLGLCNPADKNGEGIQDPEGHLQVYKIKRAKGQGKSEKRAGLRVENQFGVLSVDTRQPDRLLVPTAKSLEGDPGPLDELSELDHYKCYKIRLSSGQSFPDNLRANVGDQFGQEKLYDIKKPLRLCYPVDKNAEGIKNDSDDNHLLCYKIRRTNGEPKHHTVTGIRTLNQFGAAQVRTKRAQELCVPSFLESHE